MPFGLIDLLMHFPPTLHIVRCEPAPDILVLQIRIKTLRELLVLRRIANEARIKLDGIRGQRPHVGNEQLGNACASQKNLRNLTFRHIDSVDTNRGRPSMLDSFELFRGAEIDVCEFGVCHY